MYTRQVPGIMVIDVEKSNYIITQLLAINHVSEVKMKEFFLGWMESEARKFNLWAGIIHIGLVAHSGISYYTQYCYSYFSGLQLWYTSRRIKVGK